MTLYDYTALNSRVNITVKRFHCLVVIEGEKVYSQDGNKLNESSQYY